MITNLFAWEVTKYIKLDTVKNNIVKNPITSMRKQRTQYVKEQ